ncbi:MULTISPECIES: acyl-CoA thioesterase [Cytobacillus]|uniref:Acyl-CoA thioesterase n=1 Tax=Cytobacillus stercorigallinarum TaxID=2762240 RepID=A0ABR8QJ32_9BACI|nr:acyl-CoA thioesterase [Cytobacillus stercorigallinarum]MBD7935506.1 acyl-CoA thioesterase [Cytobacillus stercorigallinarum]
MRKSTLKVSVQQDDIDHLGHMNYMKYLVYLEKAVSYWYKEIGIGREQLDQKNLGTVMVNFDVTYKKEARVNEELTIFTELLNVGNKSFYIYQEIYNEDAELLTTCKKTFVMFNTMTRQGVPVVKEIAQLFQKDNQIN